MSSRIDLSRLRTRFASSSEISTLSLTRRSFLKSGLAAAALSSEVVPHYSGFSLLEGSGWLALHFAGKEIFRVDSSRYHGSARLWKQAAEHSLAFGIRDARFPGTDLSADLICELWSGAFGAQVVLSMESLGLSFRGFAKDWLGKSGLTCTGSKAVTVLQEDGLAVHLHGAPASFNSTGTLQFLGKSCATVRMDGMVLLCDGMQLQPADAENSILKGAAARRTLFIATRGSGHWPHTPPSGNWTYRSPDDRSLFDALEIEAHESVNGRRSHAVVATRDAQRAPVAVDLHEPLRGTDHRSLAIRLRRPVYARNISEQADSVMMAELAGPTGLQFGTLRLSLDNPLKDPALHVVSNADGVSGTLVAQATVHGTVEEAIFAPAHSNDSWPLTLSATTSAASAKQKKKKISTITMDPNGPRLTGQTNLRVLRPADFVDLSFVLDNVTLSIGPTGDIVAEKDNAAKDSFLIVQLPSQTLVEAVFGSSDNPNSDHCSVTYPAKAFLPRESRLTFQLFVDDNSAQFLDLDFLLGLEKYAASACNTVVVAPADVPDTESALAIPGGLIFSVVPSAKFKTAKRHTDILGPKDDTYSTHSKDVYRLWTARLQEGTDNLRLKAVTSEPQATSDMFGLSNLDRSSIVSELSGSYIPVQHMVVSTAGGWLKGATRLSPDLHCVSGIDPITKTDKALDSVSLNIAGGVEQVEEVSYPIFLIPTGHRGSLVKTTMRQWCRDTTTQFLEAPLITRFKIVFHEKTRTFDPTTYWSKSAGFPFPFLTVSIAIKETPTLNFEKAAAFAGDSANCTDTASTTPYWANIGIDQATAIPFSFPMTCIDRDGNAHSVSFPMVVAAGTRAFDCPAYMGSLYAAYTAMAAESYANPGTVLYYPDFLGKNVAYAGSQQPGDAAFPTGPMLFQAVDGTPVDATLVPFVPSMKQATVTLSTSQGFSQSGSAGSQQFEYAQAYLTSRFDNPPNTLGLPISIPNPPGNAAEIILSLAANQSAALSFYPKLAGGLLNSSTQIAGLSRAFGNIFASDANSVAQALSNMANDVFKVSDAFGTAAQLLGAFPLGTGATVLNDIQNAIQNAAAVPKLVAQELNELSADVSLNPVITTVSNILNLVQNFNLQSALTGLLSQLVPQIAYINAMVFEQFSTTAYADGETDLSALQTTFGADIITTLKNELSQSLQNRTQQTRQLTDPATTLVTLNQMRDYILTAGLDAASKSDQWVTLSAYPSATSLALQNTLTSDLAAFQTATQGIISQVLTTYTAVNQTLNNLSVALQAKADLSGIVSSLNDAVTLLNGITNSVTASDSGAAQTQLANVNADVTAVLNDFQAAVKAAAADPALVASTTMVLNDLATITSKAQYLLPAGALQNITTTLQGLSNFYATLKVNGSTAATAIQNFLQPLNIPKQIRASYDYDTSLKSSDLFLASKNGVTSTLSVHTAVTVNLPGSNQPAAADISISGQVNNFTLQLIPEFEFLTVGFNQASFTSTNGSAPQMNCALDSNSIGFVGPLNFVADLAQSISLPGRGLSVQTTDTGVSLAFDFSLPAITAGLFTLTGVALSSGVALDFTGGPILVTFGFANPNQHFLMAYTIFGGGGYLDLSFSPLRGISAFDISGALEFGAEAELDFGVASGDLYIFGGFLFNMTGDELDLGGYLRAGGDLNVLDLITASVEFTMSLTYENRNGQAWLVGDCDITVDVDVLWVIDESVSIDLHEEFSGS